MAFVLIEFYFASYLGAECRHGPHAAAHLSLPKPKLQGDAEAFGRATHPEVPATTHSFGPYSPATRNSGAMMGLNWFEFHIGQKEGGVSGEEHSLKIGIVWI